uniref:hypothetical protein n=1 Tax=Alistipes sp. TaxID=1872444 RepID=UPI004055B3DB
MWNKLTSIPIDKWMHIGCSEVVAALSLIITELCDVAPLWCFLTSVITMVAVTAIKEFAIDKVADPLDALANLFGAWWVWTIYVVAVWA